MKIFGYVISEVYIVLTLEVLPQLYPNHKRYPVVYLFVSTLHLLRSYWNHGLQLR